MQSREDINDFSKKELLITIGCGNKFAYKNDQYNSVSLAYDLYEFFFEIEESLEFLRGTIVKKIEQGFSFETVMFLGSCKEGYASVLLALRIKELFPDIKVGVTSFALPAYYYYRRLNFDFEQWSLNYPIYPRPIKSYHEPYYSKTKGLFDLRKQFEEFAEKGIFIFLWVAYGKSYCFDRLSVDHSQLRRIDRFISEKVEMGNEHNPVFELYKDKKKYDTIVSDNFRKAKGYEQTRH